MRSTSVSGLKVYDLSNASTLPTFLSEKSRRKLRKDPSFARRIELLQDFRFPTYSRCVRVSRDGQYILATGGYKPHIKMFDVQEVSLKFERFVDSDIVCAEFLGDDYSKFCVLTEDRALTFHTKFGPHHAVRVPCHGRDMCFDTETSDLYIANSGSSIYRFNLCDGRFRKSWPRTDDGNHDSSGNNCVVWNQHHRLVLAGGEDGLVRVYDARSKAQVGQTTVSSNEACTCVEYEPSETGLLFGVGDSGGTCGIFDLRRSQPMLQVEHAYATPIKSMSFTKQNSLHWVVSSDEKQIKGWDYNSGNIQFNIECADNKLHKALLLPTRKMGSDTSGLILACGDSEQIGAYFVPTLGPAPYWARYLESLTEELQEKPSSIFEDYRFVTKDELEGLHMDALPKSDKVRPWMHGYFVEAGMYHQITSLAREMKQTEERQPTKNQDKDQRITLNKKTKVNAKMLEKDGELIKDERFSSLFDDPDFAVDEESPEYLAIHTASRPTNPNKALEPIATTTTKPTSVKSQVKRPHGKMGRPSHSRSFLDDPAPSNKKTRRSSRPDRPF